MQLIDFAQKIEIMKPFMPKKDDLKQQAKAHALLDDPLYDLEEKYDGIRGKLIGCRFFSKDNNDKTDNVPHLRDFFVSLGQLNLILDGEVYYPGQTSSYCVSVTNCLPSTALNNQLRQGYIHFVVFDILRTPKGSWVINNNYVERRQLLEYWYNTFVKNTPMEEYIHISRRWETDKREHLEELLSQGLEGGILKHRESVYHMGAKPAWKWIKMKAHDQADLFIIGYDDPEIHYKGGNVDTWPYWREINGVSMPVTKFYYMGWIGSLRMGAYVDGTVQEITTVSGMDEALRAQITADKQGFMNKVARIDFMEYTDAGFPRHPSFHSFHEDKSMTECLWDFKVDRRGKA